MHRLLFGSGSRCSDRNKLAQWVGKQSDWMIAELAAQLAAKRSTVHSPLQVLGLGRKKYCARLKACTRAGLSEASAFTGTCSASCAMDGPSCSWMRPTLPLFALQPWMRCAWAKMQGQCNPPGPR